MNLIILTHLNKQKTEWISWDVCLTFYNTYILNSGNCWYFWNSASHSSWLEGGFISFIKCQSTIERPDSVNLRKDIWMWVCVSVNVHTQCWITRSLWQQVDMNITSLKVNTSFHCFLSDTFLFSYCLEFWQKQQNQPLHQRNLP